MDALTSRAAPSLSDLRSIVGSDNARAGSESDAIDGIPPRLVVEPGSIAQAAAVMRFAHAANLSVIPRGSGTRLGEGNPPRRADLILSTTRMNRVLEHASGDLVARVQAGVTLDALQQTLATHRQWLAIDPPDASATIGGIIAANAWGPRRLRFGAMRDLLIGLTYILPDGSVAKAGGKVVKNVAGYDLCKLFTGSFGTLGLIAEATVRLHPIPPARGILTVSLNETEYSALRGASHAVLDSPLVPSALTFRVSQRGAGICVLFEGVEPGVEAQIETARRLLAPFGVVHRERPEEFRFEASGAGFEGGDHEAVARLKVTSTLTDLPDVLNAVRTSISRGLGHGIHGYASPTVTFVDLAGPAEEVVAAMVQIRRRLDGSDVHAVVQKASTEVKREIDVWGPAGAALPLMRRVKEMFDPQGRMSPGRFVGGL